MSFTRNNYKVLEKFIAESGREYVKVKWKGINKTGYLSRIEGAGNTITKKWYQEKKREEKQGRKEKVVREDLDSYKEAIDIVYDEPYESDYSIPPEFPFQGYPISDYPSEKRLDMLMEDLEEYSGKFEVFALAVDTIIYDEDNQVISYGERNTRTQPAKFRSALVGDWKELMEELEAIAVDYGGVAILESTLKMREYK